MISFVLFFYKLYLFNFNDQFMKSHTTTSDEDEFEESLAKDTPKQTNKNTQSMPQGQTLPRSRFTIMGDLRISNTIGKSEEGGSLLSKYLKDLHQEHEEIQKQNKKEVANVSDYAFENMSGKNFQKKKTQKTTQKRPIQAQKRSTQVDNSRRRATCYSQKMSVSRMSQNMRQSWMQASRGTQSNQPGIYLYTKIIDLTQPIDFLEQLQEYDRNYSNSRVFQPQSQNTRDDQLFAKALSYKNKYGHQ